MVQAASSMTARQIVFPSQMLSASSSDVSPLVVLGSFLIPSLIDFLSRILVKKYTEPFTAQLTSTIPGALSLWLFSRYIPKEMNSIMVAIYLTYKKTALEKERWHEPINFRVPPPTLPPRMNLPPSPPVQPPVVNSQIFLESLRTHLEVLQADATRSLAGLAARSIPLPPVAPPVINSRISLELPQVNLTRFQAYTSSGVNDSDEEFETINPVSATLKFWRKLAKKIDMTVPDLDPELGADEQAKKAFLSWLETEEVTNRLAQLKEFNFSRKAHYLPAFPHLELVLGKLKNVKQLNLNENDLTHIPPVIFQLKSLEVLKLEGNCIEVLPQEITQLSHLYKFNISGNRLRILPADMNLLTSLLILDLSFNEFEGSNLQDIRFPPHLRELELSGNQNLKTLPQGIFQLLSLKRLFISRCGLSTLPLELTQLTNLVHLNVHENQISRFSADFRFPDSLLECVLSDNLFEEFPKALLNLPALACLSLNGNQLSTLPAELATLPSLVGLDLSFNRFSEVPFVISTLPRLKALDLTSNQLTYLPSELSHLSRLEELDVQENELEDLPESFQFLSSACTIYADNNRFTAERAVQLQTLFNNRRLSSNFIRGPRFNFSVHDFESGEELEGALQAEVQSWLQLSGEQQEISYYEKLFHHENKNRLHEFLTRLKETQDFQNGGQSQKNIISRAVRMLNRAVSHENFCKAMFGILQSALASCSQRIENAFDDIEVEEILSQADQLSDVELVKVLVGKKRRILLRDIAEQFAIESRQGDQLAVVQYFQVELKARLGLPISTQDLSYRGMVKADKSDLDSAADQVLRETTTLPQVCAILLKEAVWMQKFEAKYAANLEAITEEFRPQLEQIIEDDKLDDRGKLSQSQAIEKNRQKKLTEFFVQKTNEWVQELHPKLV